MIALNTLIRVPVCNLVACEDIFSGENSKIYIYNPFTAVSGKSIKEFYTYAIIEGIRNGIMAFKIQIINPEEKILKETEISTVFVEENIVRVKTKWSNLSFNGRGEYKIILLLKCNYEYEVAGSICIYIL